MVSYGTEDGERSTLNEQGTGNRMGNGVRNIPNSYFLNSVFSLIPKS